MSHAAETFQQAAQERDTAFDFRNEVRQIWHDFPEAKNTVFFLDAGKRAKLVYPKLGVGKLYQQL